MKTITFLFLVGLLTAGCNQNRTGQFCGKSGRVWRTITSPRDSTEQRIARILFRPDSTFALSAALGDEEGKWKYDTETGLLTLHFTATTNTETFSVSDLSALRMVLASEGQEIKLNAMNE